jgi:hypothetical protein
MANNFKIGLIELQNRVTRILRRGEGPTVKLYVLEVLGEKRVKWKRA